MADLKLRPRFAVDVQCDPEMVVAALRDRAEAADPPLEGSFEPDHCVLRIPEGRRYFWSPELDVTFEQLPGAPGDVRRSLRVRCLFAPRPPVWTGFAFVYSVLAVAAVASAMYGLAQLTVGHPPVALAAAPAALLLIGVIYAATFIGQGLASTQMYELRRTLDASLEHAEARARRTPKTPLESARL